jgi:hypothetical protein
VGYFERKTSPVKQLAHGHRIGSAADGEQTFALLKMGQIVVYKVLKAF